MKEAKLLSKVKRKLTSKKIHVRLKAKSERLFVSLAWMMDVAFTVCFPPKRKFIGGVYSRSSGKIHYDIKLRICLRKLIANNFLTAEDLL